MSRASGSGCAFRMRWKSPRRGMRPSSSASRYARSTQRLMMDLSASGSPWSPSAMVALDSARKASILKAIWAERD